MLVKNHKVHFDMPTDQMGWVDEDAVRNVLSQLKGANLVGVEVGAWLGRISYKMMMAGFKRVYAVDTFGGEGSYLEEWITKNNFDVLETYKKNLEPWLDRITILKGDSREVYKFIDEKVDFVFIDGDHRYSRVSEDIKNFFPLVKKGGILAGHDLDHVSWKEEHIEEDYAYGNHNGVAKAVCERFPDGVKREGRVWWVDV